MVAQALWTPKENVQRVDVPHYFLPSDRGKKGRKDRTGRDQRSKGLILSIHHTGRTQQELPIESRQKEAASRKYIRSR